MVDFTGAGREGSRVAPGCLSKSLHQIVKALVVQSSHR